MGESVKRSKSSSTTVDQASRDWTKLPDDLTASILLLANLDAYEILINYQMVCKTWYRVFCSYPSLWHTIIDDARCPKDLNVEKMCRTAVDRSSGQLVTVSLDCKRCRTGLLEYMTDRCKGIRRLRLSWQTWGHRLNTEFPLLEELDISFERLLVKPTDLERIGKSCRLLKSLKLIVITPGACRGEDDYARAIAGTMRGLQHLSLTKFHLSECALIEILDCCLHLESIYLRHTYIGHSISLRENLRQRMWEKIKEIAAAPSAS